MLAGKVSNDSVKAKSLVTYQAIFKDVICMKLSSALKKELWELCKLVWLFFLRTNFARFAKKWFRRITKAFSSMQSESQKRLWLWYNWTKLLEIFQELNCLQRAAFCLSLGTLKVQNNKNNFHHFWTCRDENKFPLRIKHNAIKRFCGHPRMNNFSFQSLSTVRTNI